MQQKAITVTCQRTPTAHYQGAPSKGHLARGTTAGGYLLEGGAKRCRKERHCRPKQHCRPKRRWGAKRRWQPTATCSLLEFMGLQILSQTMCVRFEPYDMQAPLPENLDRHGATKKHLLTCSGYAGLETTEARGKLWVAFSCLWVSFSCLWVSFSCLWVSFSCLWVPFSFFVGLLFLRGAKQSARCGSSFLACESDALFCLVIYFV